MDLVGKLTHDGVAWGMIASGAAGAVVLLDGVGPIPREPPKAWLVFAYVLAIQAAMMLGGLFVLKRRRGGPWVVLFTELAQIPVLSGGGLRYAVMPPPAIELMLFPRLGFDASVGGELTFAWSETYVPFQISISAIALLVFAWAIRHLDDLDEGASTDGLDVTREMEGKEP